jgi:hypothetical protein
MGIQKTHIQGNKSTNKFDALTHLSEIFLGYQ